MLFYLTTIGLALFLTEDQPTPREEETVLQVLMVFSAWKDSDYLCLNSMMNSLNDSLYNMDSVNAPPMSFGIHRADIQGRRRGLKEVYCGPLP